MAKQTKQNKPVIKTLPPLHKWHQLALPLGAFATFAFIGVLAYFLFTNASLAPVYAGGTAINSNASQQELERQIASAAKKYHLTLEYPAAVKKTYSLADAGMSIDAVRSSLSIKRHLKSSVLERLTWWQPIALELTVKTDGAKLANFVIAEGTIVSQVPQDATLSVIDGAAKLEPEKTGLGFGIENAYIVLKNAAAHLDSKPLVLQKAKLPAALTASHLEKSKQKLQSMLKQKITFSLNGQLITPTPSDVANWIELTTVSKAKTIDVTVNAGKVVSYIDGIVAPYVTLPRSKLVMNTSGGPIVLDYGTSGIDVTGKDDIAAQVTQQLMNNKGAQVELTVAQAEAKTVELEPYERFIVIDTTAKRLYAYEKSNLVRTVPVSAGAPNTPTVLGQYKIYSKRVSQDMRGANADGSRYFQAAVPYVNYFYGSYAIHGNYWRPSDWFGNINSSHGCVGIPDPDDAWIYNWAPVGTPVIIHD